MKILITGGAGYIGSVLVRALLERGFAVTVYDNLMYKPESLLHLFSYPTFEFIHGDVRDFGKLKEPLQRTDVVIPLAAIVGAPACDVKPEEAMRINLLSNCRIAQSLSKDQRVIYPNSDSGYGVSKDFCDERSPLNPISLYARTKTDAEKAYLDLGGVSLRLATAFGISPRMRLDLLLNDFVWRAFMDGVIVYFEKNHKRNFIHVWDVARAFIHIIDHWTPGEVYNVGLSSANVSKLELALKIKEHLPNTEILEIYGRSDPDQRNYAVSNAKIEATGWQATIGLDEGIEELLAAYEVIKHLGRTFKNL